jgi:hypothetical protein
MPHASIPPAEDCLRAILLDGVANARPNGVARDHTLVALILALLMRLLAFGRSAWILPEDEDLDALDLGFTEVRFVGNTDFLNHRIGYCAMGRAPHAACVEAGLVGDWILAGIRNRGMRPADAPARKPSPLGGAGWVRGSRAPPA